MEEHQVKIKKHVVSITLPSEYDVDKQYPCYVNEGWGRYFIQKCKFESKHQHF